MDAAGLDTAIRAWDTLELEIPEEMAQAAFLSPDLTFDSNTPPSTFTRGDTSSVQKGNAADGGDYEPMENNAMAAPPRNEAPSANEWLCEDTNCGRAFAHQYELNRHKKYHIKPHRCLKPSCASQRVAFSLKKDLLRHQTTHNGHRLYCPHGGCKNALGGSGRGFSRKDNLRRHIALKHPQVEVGIGGKSSKRAVGIMENEGVGDVGLGEAATSQILSTSI